MEPVRVDVGPCRCPGTPHESDWVDLAPKLGVLAGAAAMAAFRAAEATESEVEAAVAASFLRHGIVAWSFTGEPDKNGARATYPINNATIGELLDWSTAHEVAERCNDLYAEDLFRPLAGRITGLLNGGPKEPSTSPTTDTGAPLPEPSLRFSPEPTAGKPSEVPVP